MRGDTTQTHTILIEDDDECENYPTGWFLSSLAVVSGVPDISVSMAQANITIDNNEEFECGKCLLEYC